MFAAYFSQESLHEMIGLRVYELKQDKDRDVRENTTLCNVSDEVLKLSVMLNKMNALEVINDGDGAAAATATDTNESEANATLDTTTTSEGSDTIIHNVLDKFWEGNPTLESEKKEEEEKLDELLKPEEKDETKEAEKEPENVTDQEEW